jgi:hypothetical protein
MSAGEGRIFHDRNRGIILADGVVAERAGLVQVTGFKLLFRPALRECSQRREGEARGQNGSSSTSGEITARNGQDGLRKRRV